MCEKSQEKEHGTWPPHKPVKGKRFFRLLFEHKKYIAHLTKHQQLMFCFYSFMAHKYFLNDS